MFWGKISLLHINDYWITCAVLVETHLQTSIIARLGHDIHRERLCQKCDGVVSRGNYVHQFVTVGSLVIDIHQLAINKVRVGDGDRHRLAALGLPLGIAVLNGNIVGAKHLLALRHGALHRGGVHLRGGGHLAGDGEGELPSVGGGEAFGQRHGARHGVLLGGGVRITARRLVAVVLRRRRGSEPCEQHEQEAQCQGEMFPHLLVRAVVVFHQAVYNPISSCRICHDVIILILYFYYFLLSHFLTRRGSQPPVRKRPRFAPACIYFHQIRSCATHQNPPRKTLFHSRLQSILAHQADL